MDWMASSVPFWPDRIGGSGSGLVSFRSFWFGLGELGLSGRTSCCLKKADATFMLSCCLPEFISLCVSLIVLIPCKKGLSPGERLQVKNIFKEALRVFFIQKFKLSLPFQVTYQENW